MDFSTKLEIVASLEKLLDELAPNAKTREMYGGIIIEVVTGNAKTRIGGYFVYDEHLSLEFTNGFKLDDPQKYLEGSGKKRRHVKLRSIDDVEAKNCSGFIKQALLNAT